MRLADTMSSSTEIMQQMNQLVSVPETQESGFSKRGFSRNGVLYFYGLIFLQYVWLTGVEDR